MPKHRIVLGSYDWSSGRARRVKTPRPMPRPRPPTAHERLIRKLVVRYGAKRTRFLNTLEREYRKAGGDFEDLCSYAAYRPRPDAYLIERERVIVWEVEDHGPMRDQKLVAYGLLSDEFGDVYTLEIRVVNRYGVESVLPTVALYDAALRHLAHGTPIRAALHEELLG